MDVNNSKYGTSTLLKERGNQAKLSGFEHAEDEPNPCISPNDDDYLLRREKHLTCEIGSKWRNAALGVSFTSIVLTLVLGITAFSVSSVAKSSAAFGFAFDSLLDVITTIVVIWRFFGDKGEFYSWEREKSACKMIAVCFIVSGIGIFVRALRSLIIVRRPHEFVGIEIISGISLVCYSLLAWAKMVIADKISSSSLQTDGYNSLAGAVLSLGMLMSSLSYTWSKSIWFLDASIGLGTALLLEVYGIKLLIHMVGKDEKLFASDSDEN